MTKLRPAIPALLAVALILTAAACSRERPAADTVDPRPATITATTPAPASSSYTFAVCGDNRYEGIENGVLGRIVDSARSRGAAFVVNTGDVSGDGSRRELAAYREFTDASGLRFYTVPGNHDVGGGGVSQAYTDVIGPYYYSFDYGPDHFVLLDNADDKTGIGEEQMQWYVADLEASRSKTNTFVFTHIPVPDSSLPSGHVAGEKGPAGLESGIRMVDEAAGHTNVEAFFFGHIHAYFAYRLDGINAYITGGAGAPLYFPEAAGGYYHYLLVTVNGESVEVEVVRV